MKLTEAQKFELFKAALQGISSRPQWPKETPPDKSGQTKQVNTPFAIACWSQAIARAAIHVAENDKPPEQSSGGPSSYV